MTMAMAGVANHRCFMQACTIYNLMTHGLVSIFHFWVFRFVFWSQSRSHIHIPKPVMCNFDVGGLRDAADN
jgi:hypothetical protein